MGYPGLAHSGQPGSDQQSQFLGLFGQYMASAPSQPFVSQLEKLPPLFKVPSDATNCLYIDGVPIDAKEREVARRLRPYLRHLQTVPRLHFSSPHH
jgi:hypothetical protein